MDAMDSYGESRTLRFAFLIFRWRLVPFRYSTIVVFRQYLQYDVTEILRKNLP